MPRRAKSQIAGLGATLNFQILPSSQLTFYLVFFFKNIFHVQQAMRGRSFRKVFQSLRKKGRKRRKREDNASCAFILK